VGSKLFSVILIRDNQFTLDFIDTIKSELIKRFDLRERFDLAN